MTVFIAHAAADRAPAEALESLLERRGYFAERDDGETVLRPIEPSDALVLLLSRDFMHANVRLRLQQRALDAWACGRLVIVKLDESSAPVGFRDLPAIDASEVPARASAWAAVAEAVGERLASQPAPVAEQGAAELKSQRRRTPAAAVIFCISGAAVLAASAPFALGADWRTLLQSAEVWTSGAPREMWFWGVAGATALGVAGALARRRPRRASSSTQDGASGASVFVCYARANSDGVLPILDGARAYGGRFWLDRERIGTGDGWAHEIMRAIGAAAGVAVMCSRAAFESDHVKREVYLADRYRRKLVTVFIEEAEPPEDFAYFLAGAPRLDVFAIPAPERAQVLLRALGATA